MELLSRPQNGLRSLIVLGSPEWAKTGPPFRNFLMRLRWPRRRMDGDAQEILTGKCLPDGFDHRPRGSLILPVRGSFIRAESKHLLVLLKDVFTLDFI